MNLLNINYSNFTTAKIVSEHYNNSSSLGYYLHTEDGDVFTIIKLQILIYISVCVCVCLFKVIILIENFKT